MELSQDIATKLKKSARYKGLLILDRRGLGSLLFYEIEHYFNEDMGEIGLINFPGTRFEHVTLFDPPREWGQDHLDSCKITEATPMTFLCRDCGLTLDKDCFHVDRSRKSRYQNICKECNLLRCSTRQAKRTAKGMSYDQLRNKIIRLDRLLDAYRSVLKSKHN